MKSYRFSPLAASLVALVVVTLVSSTWGARSEKGTIITRSGQKYEAVTYKVDYSYKLITVYLDEEKKKNISFTQIEAIIREDGTDITAEVLKGYHKPKRKTPAGKVVEKPVADTSRVSDTTGVVPTKQPVVPEVDSAQVPPAGRLTPTKRPVETWKSDDDEVYRRARRKRWNALFRLTGNFSIPCGKYYDGVDPSLGFGLGLRIAVSHYLAIGLDVSRPGYDFGEDLAGYDPETGMTAIMEIDLSTMRYTISAEYYKLTKRDESNLNMIYAYTGLGAISHKMDWRVIAYDEPDQGQLLDKGTTTETKFATVLGLGASFMLSRNLGVDLGGDLFVVFVGGEDASTYGSSITVYQYAANIDLRLGLIWVL
jgi:hypothetical protein